MLKDGEYMAWFQTERGSGTGRVHLRNGVITGGDTVMSYGGTYQIAGTRFAATLTTCRHADGQQNVFGADEVEIKLTGTAASNYASCSGEVGGLFFQTTLMPVQEEKKRPDWKINPTHFHPERLPKPNVR
ncbi:hypothetical protein [Bradyrhizobium sp. WSM471]|uniref:hypothetical protein n=1 Tax=Bradyrhizobium sp. WSM471 TaxID=319017 RepID=UPI00024D225B|nr:MULTISPECIES: hypothetical protein [Bradyrhizobium]EHR01389.1 hypothetical protein Bra471DRAFT_02110 [Bradyrhizobium sp. WSM471]UFW43453.1 hypothetical protein BcanWSM471_10375 [Bradyrhizobium canariense]